MSERDGMVGTRWETAPPEVDELERQWWEQYAEVEEKYCWVHTESIQRRIRGHYVRKIVRALPANAAVLEVGCGAGWLSTMLAEYGAASVYGIDFSPEQIRRAQAWGERKGLADRVRFLLLNGSLAEVPALVGERRFDAMVIHGVLHHLTATEIRDLFTVWRQVLAAPGAQVFALEPVRYETSPPSPLQEWLLRLLTGAPLAGQRLGFRRRSAEELALERKINERAVAPPPRGPSPKEAPFAPGELETLLAPFARVESSEPVLAYSFHTARNLRLMEVSQPGLARAVGPLMLTLARRGEAAFLRERRFGGCTVFELVRAVTLPAY